MTRCEFIRRPWERDENRKPRHPFSHHLLRLRAVRPSDVFRPRVQLCFDGECGCWAPPLATVVHPTVIHPTVTNSVAFVTRNMCQSSPRTKPAKWESESSATLIGRAGCWTTHDSKTPFLITYENRTTLNVQTESCCCPRWALGTMSPFVLGFPISPPPSSPPARLAFNQAQVAEAPSHHFFNDHEPHHNLHPRSPHTSLRRLRHLLILWRVAANEQHSSNNNTKRGGRGRQRHTR